MNHIFMKETWTSWTFGPIAKGSLCLYSQYVTMYPSHSLFKCFSPPAVHCKTNTCASADSKALKDFNPVQDLAWLCQRAVTFRSVTVPQVLQRLHRRPFLSSAGTRSNPVRAFTSRAKVVWAVFCRFARWWSITSGAPCSSNPDGDGSCTTVSGTGDKSGDGDGSWTTVSGTDAESGDSNLVSSVRLKNRNMPIWAYPSLSGVGVWRVIVMAQRGNNKKQRTWRKTHGTGLKGKWKRERRAYRMTKNVTHKKRPKKLWHTCVKKL